jgi:hypothetical protein
LEGAAVVVAVNASDLTIGIAICNAISRLTPGLVCRCARNGPGAAAKRNSSRARRARPSVTRCRRSASYAGSPAVFDPLLIVFSVPEPVQTLVNVSFFDSFEAEAHAPSVRVATLPRSLRVGVKYVFITTSGLPGKK